MKTFIEHKIPPLVRIDGNGRRLYETPTGEKYPSVTTIAGYKKGKQLEQWRNRVGEEEANKVLARASHRGTSIHLLCENYLKGKDDPISMFDAEVFASIKPFLDRIDNIHCLETQLYSHHLQVAGTVDCIAEFDGKLRVIDFKTSLRPKRREWIDGYFMQTAAYCVMFEELTGIPIGRTLIIIGVDNEPPQIFDEKRDNWIDKFIQLREEYRANEGF